MLPLAGLLVVRQRERRRRFELETKHRAREALLAGASHEMQTPLAVRRLTETLARSPNAR